MKHHSRRRRPKLFRSASRPRGPHSTDVWLQVVDGGLAGVIFLVPLLMGGRHPLGQLVLVFLAVATAVAWGIRQWRSKKPKWRPTWTPLLLIAGAVLALLQVLPLPGVVRQCLDPRLAGILPLWHTVEPSVGGLGTWSYLSMTPADTSIGLALFLAYGLVFLVVVQRTSGVEDVERMMRWCALAALGMAVFGLVQFFAGNGKFFWFYQHPFTNTAHAIKGSFSNRNHFAQFLALGMGPLIWWLQDTVRRTHDCPPGVAALGGARRHELHMYLLGLAMALLVFANLLSLARRHRGRADRLRDLHGRLLSGLGCWRQGAGGTGDRRSGDRPGAGRVRLRSARQPARRVSNGIAGKARLRPRATRHLGHRHAGDTRPCDRGRRRGKLPRGLSDVRQRWHRCGSRIHARGKRSTASRRGNGRRGTGVGPGRHCVLRILVPTRMFRGGACPITPVRRRDCGEPGGLHRAWRRRLRMVRSRLCIAGRNFRRLRPCALPSGPSNHRPTDSSCYCRAGLRRPPRWRWCRWELG